MLNSKTEFEDNKITNGSHSIRLNVVIDYLIEKDILVNGEIKTKEEIEEENKRKNTEKNGKSKNKNSKNTKSNKTNKNNKTSDKKKKIKEKNEDNSSYYFSYTIAGKIEGETDVLQYSNSTYSTFHDVEVNIEFLKNLYYKQVEIKIWKLIPNNENISTSDEYIYKQIRTKKLLINNSRKNSCFQNQFKPHNTNSNYNPIIKENKNENNNDMDDNNSSNQSSLVNYNFSLIPIKPVYDSLQQLNIQFSNIHNLNSRYKNKYLNSGNNNINGNEYNIMNKNNKNMLAENNYGVLNEIYRNQNFNILTGDYINEYNNTLHIIPHPHHFTIPEKAAKVYHSMTNSFTKKSSKPSTKSNSKNKKKNNKSDDDDDDEYNVRKSVKNKNRKGKKKNNNDENNSYYDYSDSFEGKSSSKKKNKKIVKDKNKGIIRSNKLGKNKSSNDKEKEKEKRKRKGKDTLSKKKDENQYELIGKMTLDICKLFFDEYEVEKNLDYSLGEIKHFVFKLSLSEPLLSIKQRKYLNPIAIEIVSAKSMPPKPSTNKINYAMIAPTYCKFSFIDQDKEYKCYEEQRKENNKIIFNSVHLLLSGHIKEEELFNTLMYKKLNIEIHDRDYEVPKEKKYISNKFDYTESYRTTYIPNITYGVASFSLAPLVTGVKELTLISPVETYFHIKDKGSDFVNSVNYFEYGTSLKIKISLAYPILKNTISNINEITNFDFSRMIIITNKSENQNVAKLIRIISEFNIKEFFKFELEQKNNNVSEGKPGKKENDACNKIRNKFEMDKSKPFVNKKGLKLNKNLNDDKKESISNIYGIFNDNDDSNTILDKLNNNKSAIDFIMNFDIESFRIEKDQLNNPELDIITGFHVFDTERHMIFLEGPKKVIQNLRDMLNSNDFIKFKTFHSPKLTFYKRIWSSLYISPIYIWLNNNIKSLLSLNNIYLKCHTPKITLETLKLLEMINECNSMEEINSKLLFPSYEQLSSLIGIVGNNITTYEVLLQLNNQQEQEIPSYYTPNIVEESVELSQKKNKNNNSKRVDNINYLYIELIKKRLNREPNYIKLNIDKFHNLSCQQRERVYGNEGIPYNYSIQYLNSSELRKKILQEEYSKVINIFYFIY